MTRLAPGCCSPKPDTRTGSPSISSPTNHPPGRRRCKRYLRAVGIDAQVIQLPPGEVVLRSIEGETRMQAGDWGSYSINDVSAILPHFFGFTAEDYTRDPEIRNQIEDAGATRDAARRASDYARAIHAITARAYWLPLYTYTVTYGFARNLDFTPYPDELPRFFLCRWKRDVSVYNIGRPPVTGISAPEM